MVLDHTIHAACSKSRVALGRLGHSFVLMVTLRDPRLFWQCRFDERPLSAVVGHITDGEFTISGLAVVPLTLWVEAGKRGDNYEH